MAPLTVHSKLGLAYFSYFAVLGIFVPYLPMFLDGRGFNSYQIGVLLAVVTGARIIGPSLWALVAEKRGCPVSVMRLGALLAALGWLISFFEVSYWPLVWAMALYSLFWTAILPQLEVSAFHYLENDNKQYGRIRSFGSVGYIVVVVLGGVLLQQLGSEFLPWFTTLFLVFLLWILWQLPSFSTKAEPGEQGGRFRQLLRNKTFAKFMGATFLMQLGFAPFYGFFMLYCRDLGYSGTFSGLMIALAVLAEIIAFYFAGSILQRIHYRTLLMICYSLTVVRWLMVAFLADEWYWLALSMLFHAGSFALAHSAAMQFVQNFFPKAQRSRGQALYAGVVYGGGGALGAYVAGVLWADGAGATLTFVAGAIAAAAACAVVWALPRAHESKAAGQ